MWDKPVDGGLPITAYEFKYRRVCICLSVASKSDVRVESEACVSILFMLLFVICYFAKVFCFIKTF